MGDKRHHRAGGKFMADHQISDLGGAVRGPLSLWDHRVPFDAEFQCRQRFCRQLRDRGHISMPAAGQIFRRRFDQIGQPLKLACPAGNQIFTDFRLQVFVHFPPRLAIWGRSVKLEHPSGPSLTHQTRKKWPTSEASI